MTVKLDSLYNHQLSGLPSWGKWTDGLQVLSAAAKKAFAGEINLHDYGQQIKDLAGTYQALGVEYLRAKQTRN
ncbi:MAG TPA: hypothetical protein VGI82_03950 [Chitinophagaceae bacterium]